MSLAPIATDDPGQLQLELARVKRVAEANRKRLRLFKVRPESPRGVNLDRGYISWEEPHELSNVTHYNIYADDDTKLFRRVPVGQTRLSDIMPDTQLIWVSAFNEESGLESIKTLAGSNIDPDVSGENPITEPPEPPAGPAKLVDTVAVTYESQSANDAAGSKMNRLKISWAKTGWTQEDQDNCTGFAVWGKSANSDGSNQDANYVILAVVDDPNATAVYSPWLPTATTDKKWTAWVMTRNKDGILNPVATAPSASTVVPKGVGTLDLRTAWNFDPSIFDVSGPKFTITSLDAGLIKTGTIKLGGSGVGKPGNMFVYDYQSPGVENFIGWVGAYSGYYGAWFKNLWVGGTNPSDANIRMENGNLSIWDAQFTVRRSSPPASNTQKIYTSPVTFGSDAIYNSLALVNEETSSTDKSELVSRGVVLWRGATKVGAFVSAGSGLSGSLIVYGPSSRSIKIDASNTTIVFDGATTAPGSLTLDGDAATVRADGGYGMSGAFMIDGSGNYYNFGGTRRVIIDPNGVFQANGVAGRTQQLNVALYPSGWAELYIANGIINGIVTH